MREMTSEDVLKQQKARAMRVDHTYYNKPHPWRTWMRILSFGLPLAAAVIVGAVTFSKKGASLYQPGPVSTRHSMFSSRCEDCHEKAGTQFGAVSNAKCLVCHDGPLHNDRQVFAGPDKLKKIVERKGGEEEVEAGTPRCASCHTEHKGATSLITVNDSHCTQCHADLKVSDGKKLNYDHAILGFSKGLGHPEWKALRPNPDKPDAGRDETPLRFNHVAHLNDKKVRYKEASAKGDRGTECADCHRPDDQRRYMQPISFDRHCAECHDLKDVAGVHPPHGKADTIRALVRARLPHDDPGRVALVSKLSEPAKELDAALRQIEELKDQKGKGKLIDELTDKAAKLKDKLKELSTPIDAYLDKTADELLKKELFARGDTPADGTCMYCHTANTQIESNVVVEPNIPSRWLKHSFFNHETHRVVSCKDCHAQALGSKQTSDVLLPGIESCQKCHVAGNARTDCFECHIYHDKTHQNQTGSVSIEGLLSQGAGAAVPQGKAP